MKILITGGDGMLGRTLARHLERHELVLPSRQSLDIGDTKETHAVITEARPNTVIHCAAMTEVDWCESDQDEAFRVNAMGTTHVACATAKVGARLIAISSDYVFSGELDRPYHEWDTPGPRTVYGKSKLAAEDAIRTHCPDHLILRIAWLYGPGGPSFVHTMMQLGRRGGPPLKVVDDQRGNPTSTDAVAKSIAELLEVPVAGTFHLTCEGETTWYGLATETLGLLALSRGTQPCTTDEFPRPAPRPKNSRLENRALRLAGLTPLPHWRDALEAFLKEFPNG